MLHTTYLICFIDERLFPDEVYHHTFRVGDQTNGVLLCKDLELHVVELSKFGVTAEEVKTDLEKWCYFLKHGASLDLAHLPATLDDPAIRQAAEVLMKASQDEIERARALSREMAERDAKNLVAELRFWQEEFRSVEANLKKGQRIGRIQLLQQLLQQPETPGEELERLAEQDLLQMEDSLRRQLSPPKAANGTPPTEMK
jgi:hypothetical protein